MSAAGSGCESKSSLLVVVLANDSGVAGASFQSPQPQLRIAFAASEQTMGGAPFAAVRSAPTSIGTPRCRPWSKSTFDLARPMFATAGPPPNDENAKVAI